MKKIDNDGFYLSTTKHFKGSRRLAREKALQIITAFSISDEPWEEVFTHVFYRDFNMGDDEQKFKKVLTQDEVKEVEADTPIVWETDEIEFGHDLINNTLQLRDEVDRLIEKIADNWELDRIALIDRILIEIATAEFLKFPEIPTKVSINDAIDIAKKYSTDRSSNFINGVLDKILEQLNSDNQIQKTGRGLINK